jgi:hypothetical protein
MSPRWNMPPGQQFGPGIADSFENDTSSHSPVLAFHCLTTTSVESHDARSAGGGEGPG